MTDLKDWIYSADVAEWLKSKEHLEESQIVSCILAAPHRSIEEKISAMREINAKEAWMIQLCDEMESVLRGRVNDRKNRSFYYEIEIFCNGSRESFYEKRIFTSFADAREQMILKIQNRAKEYEIREDNFYGILNGFREVKENDIQNDLNFIVDSKGSILYVMQGFSIGNRINEGVDMSVWESDFIRLPYATGTIVQLKDNPFFTNIKGVIYNVAEPDEVDFAEDKYGQWLICQGNAVLRGKEGIQIINIVDEYTSYTLGADFQLPLKQFFKRCNEPCKERDEWLWELAALLRQNKGVFSFLMEDRQPGGNRSDIDRNADRHLYIRELAERMRRTPLSSGTM